MDSFDLSGVMSLDASDMVGGVEDATDASSEFSDEADRATESLFEFDAAGAAAGATLAGVGTAAQGLLDNTQALRESLGRTSASLGMTSKETKQLATDLSNATFPVKDVAGTLDVLSQAGVEGEAALTETANAADMVADATGNSAEQIADSAVPALRAMGGEAGDLSEQMDTFTFIARETTLTVDDFSRVVTKLGPEIQEMGLGVEESAAILAALEEQGLDSRTAMREFRQAANSAEGDQEALMESLGLSTEELEAQQDALEEAEGATEAHAEAANESLSTMDSLTATFDDLKLRAGSVIQPLSAAAPAMQAAGIAALTLSTINTGALIPSLAGVVAAVAPLLPILLPLVAVGGLLAAVFGDDIVAALGDAQAWISDTADTIDNRWGEDIQALIEEAGKTWAVISSGIENVAQTVDDETQFIQDLVRGTFEGVVPRVASTGIDNLIELISVGLSLMRGDWSGAMDGIKNITDNTTALVGDLFDDAMGQARKATGVAGDRIRGRLGDLAGWVDSEWPIQTNLVGAMRDAQKDGTSISDALAEDVRDDLAGLNDWIEETFGVNLKQRLGGAFDGGVDAIGEAFGRLDFGPLESGLDAIGGHVEDLISGLNSLSGVSIDVDIPSFEGVMDRATDIVGGSSGDSSGGLSDGSGSGEGGGDGSSSDSSGGGFDPGGRAGRVGSGGPMVGLASGGLIESAGAAILHEGERVVPEAQVADRGPATGAGGGVSPGDLRAAVADALNGAGLSLSGELAVEAGVATMSDVQAEIRSERRRQADRARDRGVTR